MIASLLLTLGRAAITRLRRGESKPVDPPFKSNPEALVPDGRIDYQALFQGSPSPLLALSPALFIIDASDAYLAATMTERAKVVGRHLFEVFPDNQDNVRADGVANLRASLECVLRHGRGDEMDVQRYDIRRPDNTFEVRYWKPVNVPIVIDGAMLYILHHVVDVTENARASRN